MKAITVNDLAKMCEVAKLQGLGNKKILLSDDDECNGFHEAFEGISLVGDTFEGQFAPHLHVWGVDKNMVKEDYVIIS